MLKTDSLPADQQARNNKLNGELGRLGVALLLLSLIAVGGLVGLYLKTGNGNGSDLQVSSKEGLLLGFAVAMSADYVVTDSDIPSDIQLNTPDHSLMPARKVRSEIFEENIVFSLVHVDTPLPATAVRPLGGVDPSQPARVAISGGRWEGTLKARASGDYLELDPPLTLGPGLPIYQSETLVAISAQTVSGVIVAVPASLLLTKFKELSPGQ